MQKSFSSRRDGGSACVELAAAAPLIALFIIITVQFAALFTRSIRDLASAEEAASGLTLEWDLSQTGRGFGRPCLEKMPIRSVKSGGYPVPVGVGPFQMKISIPSEVRIVAGNICED